MTATIIRGLLNVPTLEQGCVLTIGNFDGVHLGHQAILRQLNELAREQRLPSCVMVFEPQPAEFFTQDKIIIPRLMRWSEKYQHISELGIDYVFIMQFNKDIANLSAADFIQSILVDKLHVKSILIGDDFRFGKNRSGDFAFLKEYGLTHHFSVQNFPSIKVDNVRISSTAIRNALTDGDHSQAEKMLGRPFQMTGHVVHGEQLGRKLGFPTANIFVRRKVTPVHGIYAVRMHGITPVPLPGVANIGTRPAVNGTRLLLEVYLFNFSETIYGRKVTVEFCYKIRNEEYFVNLDLLKQAIANDVAIAHAYFVKTGELTSAN